MCLSADELNPLCDDCFVRQKALKAGERFEPCEACKKYLKHYCSCCMVYKPGEVTEEGLCRKCRQEFDIE